jgi:hypothetical protein
MPMRYNSCAAIPPICHVGKIAGKSCSQLLAGAAIPGWNRGQVLPDRAQRLTLRA